MRMKYVVVLCDGMADEPLEELGGMTPLEKAHTPNLDRMAQISEIGMVQTVPDGMAPGSDTANLSVIQGYKVGAFRYIVKPVESGDFLSAVEELLDRQQKKQASIFSFPSINGTTKLMTDHIYYLESDLRTIRVVAKEGTFTFTGTISSLEEQLRPDGFIRIHKSFLVNVSHIYNIFKDSVTMDNKEVLPMSKHKRREVNQEFLSYMEANL